MNTIETEQATPTRKTEEKCKRLLNYVATYPNAFIRYHTSEMVLHIDSDAAYLVMNKAQSRVVGYYYLGPQPKNTSSPTLNGPILIECKTIKNMVAPAAEAEIDGLFHKAQRCIPIRFLLNVLGHRQSPIPISTDNATAHGFIHDNIN